MTAPQVEPLILTGILARLIREHRNLSQTELAVAADVGRSTIQNLENGRRETRPSVLRRIARALEVDPRVLRHPSAEVATLAVEVDALDPAERGPLVDDLDDLVTRSGSSPG